MVLMPSPGMCPGPAGSQEAVWAELGEGWCPGSWSLWVPRGEHIAGAWAAACGSGSWLASWIQANTVGSGTSVCSWPGLEQAWVPGKTLGDGAEWAPIPCPPSCSLLRCCPELDEDKEAREGWGRWGQGESGSHRGWGCWRETCFGAECGPTVSPVRAFQQERDVWWGKQALGMKAKPQGLCSQPATSCSLQPWLAPQGDLPRC